MIIRSLIAGAAVVAVSVLAPLSAQAQEVSLRFASLTPAGGYIHSEHLQTFVDKVEADSQGRIAIDLQPVNVFGSPRQLYELVESGVIDIAWTVQGYTSGRFPQSSVVELPFLLNSAETGTRVFWKLFEEGLFERDYGSVKILGLYTHRPYGIFTTNTLVQTMEDMEGLKMRTPSALVGETLEALGAVPVGLPVTEIPENLRLGVIDGTAYPWEAIELFGMTELLENLTDARMAAPRFVILMNKARYEGLADDLKEVIDHHGGETLSVGIGAGLDTIEREVIDSYLAEGQYNVYDLPEDERARMKAAAEPVIEGWLEDMASQGVDGEALLKRTRELIAEIEG